jgi:hypothetical protein
MSTPTPPDDAEQTAKETVEPPQPSADGGASPLPESPRLWLEVGVVLALACPHDGGDGRVEP